MSSASALRAAYQSNRLAEEIKRFLIDEVPKCCPVKSQDLSFTEVHDQLSSEIFSKLEAFLVGDEPLDTLGSQSSIKKDVCGHLFKPNEPCFTCSDCGTDPTCVLCRSCFLNSEHVNHKYHMFSSSGSGYCDCGDKEAWTSNVHCRLHAPATPLTVESHEAHTTSPFPSVTHPLDVVRVKCLDKDSEAISKIDHLFVKSPSEEEIRYMRHQLSLVPAEMAARFHCLYQQLLAFVWETLRAVVLYPERAEMPLYELPATPVDSRDYCVYLFNDEKHTFDQVEDILTRCVRMSKEDAIRVANNVDRNGRCSVFQDSITRCVEIQETMKERSQRVTRYPLRCETWHATTISQQDFACHILAWLGELVERYPCLRAAVSIPALGLTEAVIAGGRPGDPPLSPLVSLTLNGKSFVRYFMQHHTRLWKNARNYVTNFVMSVLCQDILYRKLFAIEFTRVLPIIFAKYVEDDHTNVDNIEHVSCQIYTVISLAAYLLEHEDVASRILEDILTSFSETQNPLTAPSLATIPPTEPSTTPSPTALLSYVSPSSLFGLITGTSDTRTKEKQQRGSKETTPLEPKRRLYLEHTQEMTIGHSIQLHWHKGVRLMHCFHTLGYVLRSLQDKSVPHLSLTMWEHLHNFWDVLLQVLTFGQDMIPIQRALQQHVEMDTQVWSGLYFLDMVTESIRRSIALFSRNPEHLLTATKHLLQYFNEEVKSGHRMQTIQLNNLRLAMEGQSDFPMVHCVVSRHFVSIFQPLVHCVAMALHHMLLEGCDLLPVFQIVDKDLATACAHLIERPLRVFVITGQTLAGLWTLNGFTVAMLGNRFHSSYIPFVHWNLSLLQLMACFMHPDHFLALLIYKFELEKYCGLVKSKSQVLSHLSKRIEVASRFLTLLYQVVTHRCRQGVGLGVGPTEEYRDLLLHLLCAGPKGRNSSSASERSISGSGGMTHSQILNALRDLQLVDENQLDSHLGEVSTEKEHPGTNAAPSVILFEPRVDLLRSAFTPFHYTYLPRDTAYAEELVRKRLNDTSSTSSGSSSVSAGFIPPRAPLPLTSEFAPLSSLTSSRLFVHVLTHYLELVVQHPEGLWWNCTGLELVLHLVAIALFEDEAHLQSSGTAPFLHQVQQYASRPPANTVTPEPSSSSSSAEERDILETNTPDTPVESVANSNLWNLLESLLSKWQSTGSHEISLGLVKWTGLKWRQVELLWRQKLNPSMDVDAAGSVQAMETEDPFRDAIAQRESEEIRKQREREERKERMLRIMADRQRAFMEAAKAKFGDLGRPDEAECMDAASPVQPFEDEEQVTSKEIRASSAAEGSDTPNVTASVPSIERLPLTASATPLAARSHTCILCQSKDEEGNVQRPLCIIASVLRSSVLSLANHEARRFTLPSLPGPTSGLESVPAEMPVSTEKGLLDLDEDLSEDGQRWRESRIYQPAANNEGAPAWDYRTDRPAVLRWNPPEGTMVVSCGHVVHQECVEATKITTARGRPLYVCSLCKRNGNSLLFLLPPSPHYLPGIFVDIQEDGNTRRDVLLQTYNTLPNGPMTNALLGQSTIGDKSDLELWLESMSKFYMTSYSENTFCRFPPNLHQRVPPLAMQVMEMGRLVSEDANLQRLEVVDSQSHCRHVLQSCYAKHVAMFHSTVCHETVVESLWPSAHNHWSAILGIQGVTVPPADVAHASMLHCLVYTLATWERHLRLTSPTRTFFNSLADYQLTFLRALCRTAFLLREPVFTQAYLDSRDITSTHLTQLSTAELQASGELRKWALVHWRDQAALWCVLDTVMRDVAMLSEHKEDNSRIPLLQVDCVSLLVALIHSRDTQMRLMLEQSNESWSRALAIQLIVFAVRISFALHLVQVILTAPELDQLFHRYVLQDNPPTADPDALFETEEMLSTFLKVREMAGLSSSGWTSATADMMEPSPLHVTAAYLRHALLPYLRMSAYIVHHVVELQPSTELRIAEGLPLGIEVRHLLTFLGLPHGIQDILLQGEMATLVKSWCQGSSVAQTLANKTSSSSSSLSSRLVLPQFPAKIPQLIDLPRMYTEILELSTNFKCNGKTTTVFLCLLCGRLVCARGVCCMPRLQQRSNVTRNLAGAEAHALHYHSGYALMLSIFNATVHVILKGAGKSAVLDAPYKDQYGEQDRALKRGNPLFFHKESYENLQKSWLAHQHVLHAQPQAHHEEFFLFG